MAKVIKSKRNLPNLPYFYSLIEWTLPNLNRRKSASRKAQTIHDLARSAKKRVPRVVYDYVEGSAFDEIGSARSSAALRRVQFNARTLRDVSNLDSSEMILGQKVDLPIIFSPTGYTRLMHHVGEPAVASVASKNNLIYSLSTMGTTSPEELTAAVPLGRKWFQLYVMQNRADSVAVINQARRAGFEALILTVDTPVSGLRLRDFRNGLTIPPRIRPGTVLAIARKPVWWINLFTTKKLEFAAFRGWDKSLVELAATIFSPAISFDDVKWLQETWKGPVIVKGVQSVEDAITLAKMGVEGIVLSNHGGRQLDRGPVPVELLPDVVKAVGKKLDVYIDGSIMSGQDVYAAIALGAKAVFIGRAYLYGLMADGERGVEKVVELLRRDFLNTMALTGNRTLAEVRETGAIFRNE
ncbi:MAG: alpha-hydroxy acid oxidase [Actinobacteria bacterium]|nr:alpha-hydroxy acid oxidase [Actinomycetota bacterium]